MVGRAQLADMTEAELSALPRSKKEARVLGSKYYFTGNSCCNGHVDRRFVSSGHCFQCNRRHGVEWADENRDRKNELHRSWCANNKEKKDAYPSRQKVNPATKRKWNENNRDKLRASSKKYYLKNKEKWPPKVRLRYAKAKNATGLHTAGDIAEIMKLQRSKCAYCRIRLGNKYHVDHIIALDSGGANDRTNLQILCAPCNLKKGTKHPVDFARQLGMLI